MTPRQHRIATQIRWLIDDTGGDCTLHDMAKFCAVSWRQCRAICDLLGWSNQYRKVDRSSPVGSRWDRDEKSAIHSFDAALEGDFGGSR